MDRRCIWLAGIAVSILLLTWSGCGGGSSSSNNNPPPPPPPKFHGTPYTIGTIVTATTSQPEAEEVIAIDPNNHSNLAGMITDYSLRTGGSGTTRYSVSTNGGGAWKDMFVPLSGGTTPTTSDGALWDDNRDPSLGIDKLGNVFLSGIYAQAPSSGPHPGSGVYVCAGTLPAVNLTASVCRPVFTNTSSNDPYGEDKDSLAVDNSSGSNSGNVYVTWIHFTGCSASGCTSKYIAAARSTDHGVTWSAPVLLTSGTTDVEWPQMTVGSDGTVYASFEVALSNNQAQHMLSMSTDGGQTFSTPAAITPSYADVTFSASYRKNSGPTIVVSPVNGAEYVYDIYAQQNGAGSDIVVTRSNAPKGAGGFTTPISVNDSTAGQRIFPAAAVDNSGIVHMSWFDTRNASGTAQYDIYATYSLDQGATFAPNARVTSALISAGTFIGDYAGMVAEPTGGIAHPVWTNGGSNAGTLQTTTLTAP